MENILRFLPLFFWGTFAFCALYTLLETEFKPINVISRSAVAAAQILTRHWRLGAALLGVFAMAPVVEVFLALVMKLQGQSLVLAGFLWQGLTAATIAWIATHIHVLTLALSDRTPSATLRYRMMSAAAGVGVFLSTVVLSVGSSLLIDRYGLSSRYGMEFWARIVQTLSFVPLALVRPALSLGMKNPVASAFVAVARSPIVLGVWVTALSLPVLVFDLVGGDILNVHRSLQTFLGLQAAKVLFNVTACALFETATLLLLARASGRIRFSHHLTSPEIVSVADATAGRIR